MSNHNTPENAKILASKPNGQSRDSGRDETVEAEAEAETLASGPSPRRSTSQHRYADAAAATALELQRLVTSPTDGQASEDYRSAATPSLKPAIIYRTAVHREQPERTG